MTGRKVVIVKGSPRRNGNSSMLADRVAAGARDAGAEVESFYLHGMQIQPCDACDSCQAGVEMGCAIDDDMQSLYPKLQEAEAILIASPVYWFNVSSQTKIFIDRLYALGGDEPMDHALSGKRFAVVMTGEDKDPFASGAINAFRAFQDMFRYIGAYFVGWVFGSALEAGEISTKPEVLEEAYDLGRKLVSKG